MADVAARYARAFAEVVDAAGLETGKAQQQLRDFADTLAGSTELREVLMNPSLEMGQKLKVLDAIAKRTAMPGPVRNFIAVIVEHQRLDGLEEILEEYHKVADADAGIAEAQITSAHPLSAEERTRLESEIAKLAGMRVQASYAEDETLLGGAVVPIGSKIYDGSVRAQLQQLKQRLVNA